MKVLLKTVTFNVSYMGSKFEYYWLIIIFILFIVPIQSLNAHSERIQHPRSNVSQSNTTFEIAKAQLDFRILSTGDYRCDFSLELVGNNITAAGLGEGEFTIPSLEIFNFTLRYFTFSQDIIETKDNGSSIFNFNLSQIIPEGVRTTLAGDFSGTIWNNMSGVYSYKLGIDWGITVGDQVTRIIFDGHLFNLISTDPTAPSTSTFGSFLILTWNEVISNGFSCDLLIKPSESSSNDLLVLWNATDELEFWNASVGQVITVVMKNIGLFELEGFIDPSSWIHTNVSRFTLIPSQEIVVQFSISNSISLGMNGSIEIIIFNRNYYYFPDAIIIPVYVAEGNQNQIFSEFLIFGIFFVLVISSVMAFQKREKIQPILNEKFNSFRVKTNPTGKLITNSSDQTQLSQWKSIHSKWNHILSELEMKTLKILFFHGDMNQQTISDEIGVSKGTISRVISRLEMKKLLYRERSGISNLIKINHERFP